MSVSDDGRVGPWELLITVALTALVIGSFSCQNGENAGKDIGRAESAKVCLDVCECPLVESMVTE